MRFPPVSRHPDKRSQTITGKLLANEGGATAVEFGLLAPPLLLFIVGLIGYGLYFFTESSLEYGVEAASRKIRTGQVNSAGTQRDDKQMTVNEFKRSVCTTAGPLIDCDKLQVHVESGEKWSEITPPTCTNAEGGMTGSGGDEPISTYSGGASRIVLVTLCYNWDLAKTFGTYLKLPTGMQATAAFKSEPYS